MKAPQGVAQRDVAAQPRLMRARDLCREARDGARRVIETLLLRLSSAWVDRRRRGCKWGGRRTESAKVSGEDATAAVLVHEAGVTGTRGRVKTATVVAASTVTTIEGNGDTVTTWMRGTLASHTSSDSLPSPLSPVPKSRSPRPRAALPNARAGTPESDRAASSAREPRR